MDEQNRNDQPTKNSSLVDCKPSSDLRENKAKRILTLLGRLALHYYRPDFTESQAALMMEDMIADLIEFDPSAIETACAAWRKKDVGYFPKSGQLIACIRETQDASIANARANRPAFKSYQRDRLLSAPIATRLKPWQEILRERGLIFGKSRVSQ